MTKVKRPGSALLSAIKASQPMRKELAMKTIFHAQLSWYKLCHGAGSVDAYNDLVWTINVVEEGLQRQDIHDFPQIISAANQAALGIRGRWERTGRWGVDAASLHAIPPIFDLFEQFIPLLSIKQMEAILTAIERRRTQ